MSDKFFISTKPPKGEDGFTTFSVRIENDLVDILRQISGSSKRSRNEVIRILLRFAVSHCMVKPFPPKAKKETKKDTRKEK